MAKAGAGAIRAGKAFIEFFADDRQLRRGLQRASKKLKAFGEGVNALGLKFLALGTSALVGFSAAAKVFSDVGDEVAKMSKRTGVAVETLSALSFVASQTGTDFNSVEKGLRRMSQTIIDAERGLTTAKDGLAALGLESSDLINLLPIDQFKLLGERISLIENPTRKAAVAMMVFGSRIGTALLPMFEQGAKGIEKLIKEAKELGIVISTEDAKAAAEFTDILDKLWKVMRMGVFLVGASIAPVLGEMADRITSVVVNINKFINQNRDFIVSMLKLAAGVTAVGAGIVILGTGIIGVGTIFGGLATILTSVVGAFGLVASILGTILSPIALISLAIVGLSAKFLLTSDNIKRASKAIKGIFNDLKTSSIKAFKGISNALVAGDIELAARILFLSLKIEVQKGIDAILAEIDIFKKALEDVAGDITKVLTLGIIDVKAELSEERGREQAARNISKLARDFRTAAEIARDRPFDEDPERRRIPLELDKLGELRKELAILQIKAAEKAAEILGKTSIEIKEPEKPFTLKPIGIDPFKTGVVPLIDKIRESMKSFDRISVVGTFNALAVQSLQGGRANKPEEKTAEFAEKNNAELKKIGRLLESGRAVFD